MNHRKQAAWTGGILLVVGCMAFGQGSLVPSGGPAETMVRLDQIQSLNTTAQTEVASLRAAGAALSGAVADLQADVADNEPRTPISSVPYTITQSGSYYVTGNLVTPGAASGIWISADDVTLDLNGFSIIGNGTGAYGVVIEGFTSVSRRRVVVRNGMVRNFSCGVFASYLCAGRIENIHAANNSSAGICLYGYGGGRCNGNVIRDCVADGNDQGFRLDGNSGQCNGNVLKNCTANENGYGFLLTAISGQCYVNMLEGCTAVGNTNDGIHFNGETGGSCDGNSVRNCSVSDSGVYGMRLYGGSGGTCSGNSVQGCTIVSNAATGVYVCGVEGECNGNQFKDCTSANNVLQGFNLYSQDAQCNGNSFRNCMAMENAEQGFYLTGVTASSECRGNLIDGLISRDNVGWGVYFFQADRNVVRNCRIGGNAGAIILHTSDQNRIESNRCAGTATYGLDGFSPIAVENLVLRNVIIGYSENYPSMSSNVYGPEVSTFGELSTTGDDAHPWANFSY